MAASRVTTSKVAKSVVVVSRVSTSQIPADIVGPFQFTPRAGERNAIVWTGASYVFGEQGFPELSTTQPYDNERAVNLTDPHTPQAAALIDLIALADRESLLEGSTNQLARNWAAARDWIVHHRAIGGSEIGDHDQGSTGFTNQMGQVDDVVTLVDPDTVVYRAFCQEGLGFFDLVVNGTPWATVEGILLDILADYRTEISTRTGQSFVFPLFMDQFGFWALSGTPSTPLGALEQLALALSNSDVILVGPGYPYDVGADNIHLTNEGYRAMAEHWGEVLYTVLGRGQTWLPLYATACEAGPSNTIILTYHVPAISFGRHGGGDALVLDTTAYGWREAVADGTTHGFRYIENGNPARSITGVSVSGNQVTLQLDGAPADGAEIGVSDLAAQPPSGPSTNLRDNWTSPVESESGNDDYLYNWACVQQIAITGAPSFANNFSLEFDGVNEFVTCGDVDTLNGATLATISVWVRSPSWGSGTEGILGKTRATHFDVRALAGGALRWYIASTTNFTPASTVFADNTWYNIVLAFNGGLADGSRVAIYVNGAAATGTPSGVQPTTMGAGNNDPLVIGALTAAPASLWTGNIDEVAIWSGVAVTLAQAQEIYNAGSPADLEALTFAAPNHWWRMGDGATFPTIPDQGSTGGFDGTMTNMEAGDISSTVP